MLAAAIAPAAADRIVQFIELRGPSDAVLGAMRQTLAGDAPALAAVDELELVVQHLTAMGVDAATYTVAPQLARGLSYYTGVVFEAVIAQPPIGSLLGGGRYDNLIGIFAGRSIPTVGTAFGIERLQIVMSELGLGPDTHAAAEVYVTIFAPELATAALQVATTLRQAGRSVITALKADKLGKQLKEAADKAIPYAIILGPDELARDEVIIRDLRTGEQRTVQRAGVADALVDVV